MGKQSTSEGAIMFEVGDKAQVMRGQFRGKSAEILAPADPGQKYAVRFDDGALAVINAVNLKAPAEGSIGAGKLAAELQTAVSDARDQDARDTLQALVSRLEAEIPGLGGRISWPAEPASH
jgi:hypothetical protein